MRNRLSCYNRIKQVLKNYPHSPNRHLHKLYAGMDKRLLVLRRLTNRTRVRRKKSLIVAQNI